MYQINLSFSENCLYIVLLLKCHKLLLVCTSDRPTSYYQCTSDRPTSYYQCTSDRPTSYYQCTSDRPTSYYQCTSDRPTSYYQWLCATDITIPDTSEDN